MAKKFRLGRNFKLYRSETLLDGSTNTPDTVTWIEIPDVKDVTHNQSGTEVDVTTRASGGRRQTAQGIKETSLEFELPWNPDDASFQAIRDAYNSGDELAMAAVDGDIGTSGTQGAVANFTITQFNIPQPLDEESTVSVTAKPQSHEEWYEAA